MDPSTRAQLKAGTHAIAEIQKAIRFFRLYPHEHPFCAEGLERSFARLSEFTAKHGALEVEVGRDGLFWEGESLLPEADQVQSSDLNVLLFMEGVRELTFEPSLSEADLRQLIEILSASYTEAASGASQGGGAFADDLLTALWREEFGGFGFKVFDPLASNFSRTSDEEGALGAVAGRIQELAAEFGVAEGAAQDDPAWLGARAGPLAPDPSGPDPNAWGTRPERARQFLASEAGAPRAALLNELLDPAVADRLARAAEVVRWVIGAAPDLVAREDAVRFLAGSILHALVQGDLPQALRLSELTRDDAGRASLSRAVARELSGPAGIAALARAFTARAKEAGAGVLAEEGGRYLALLDPELALPALCERYAEEEERAVRAVLRAYLGERAQAVTPWLLERARGEDPAAARDAVELLAGGGAAGPTFEALRALARGQSAARAQATEALDRLSGADERRRLLEIVLQGPVRSDRLHALGALDPGVRTYEGLLPLVEGDELLDRDGEEQAALLDLLVRAGGVRARVALQRLSERRLPMFRHRAEAERLKQLATRTLERLKRREEGS